MLLATVAAVACSSPVDGEEANENTSDLVVPAEQERARLAAQFDALESRLVGKTIDFEQDIAFRSFRGTPNLTEGSAVCHLEFRGSILSPGTYEEKGATLVFAGHGSFGTLDQAQLDSDKRLSHEVQPPEMRGGARSLHFPLGEIAPMSRFCPFQNDQGDWNYQPPGDTQEHCYAPLEVVCVVPPGTADMESAVVSALASSKVIAVSK